MNYSYIKTDNEKINIAYHIAVSDLFGNIKPYTGGMIKEDKPVIIAGMGYETPWTRDASINTRNAGALLFPEETKNTLLSVLEERDGKLMIGGEYWDSIIWVWGAWCEYVLSGDKEFLKMAYEASVNTIKFFEETEFSKELNLFRGPACYGDGVAAYPDIYARPGESGIISFASECKDLTEKVGVGIPMYTLSTNCLYYKAYETMNKMAKELGVEEMFKAEEQAMKKAVNDKFWNEKDGKYNYLIDNFGGCDFDEGMGHSFVILFDIADEEKREKVFKNQHITDFGIPCVYPSFSRYEGGYGRHSGTVWPHIQGFWADAAAKNKKFELFDKEFNMLTECSTRDGYFSEIYHPDNGARYGGLQEYQKSGIIEWESEKKQTWSATGYLHMLYSDIIGMEFNPSGIEFSPYLPKGIGKIESRGLKIRGNNINITVKGSGSKIKSFSVNGEECANFVDYNGNKDIEIVVED